MVNWIHDGIGPVLGYMVATTAMRVAEAMEEGALELEAYAKSTAPWSDRTGMAREGLYANVEMDGGSVVIEVGHTMDYGQWLELIQDGRFAVIMPTIEALGPEIILRAGGKVTEVGSTF